MSKQEADLLKTVILTVFTTAAQFIVERFCKSTPSIAN